MKNQIHKIKIDNTEDENGNILTDVTFFLNDKKEPYSSKEFKKGTLTGDYLRAIEGLIKSFHNSRN